MPAIQTIELTSPDDTERLGRRLARSLFPGAVVALIGPLGAGKTYLVRAIAEGLGVPDPRAVTSPTFVLIQEYPGRLPMFHFDAYRLPSPAAFSELGAHEYFQSSGVSFVEWADRVESCLPQDHLRISFEVTGSASRRLTIEGRGPAYEQLVTTLGEAR